MKEDINEMTEDTPEFSFFMFINSGSGAGLGQRLVTQEVCVML